METIKFTPERIGSFCKVSKDYITEMNLTIGESDDDFIMKSLTVRLDALIMSSLVDEKIIHYYFARPTFFEWLLRKERKVDIKITAKDLFKNPPAPNSDRIFLTEFI
jgi:hypothetical protein